MGDIQIFLRTTLSLERVFFILKPLRVRYAYKELELQGFSLKSAAKMAAKDFRVSFFADEVYVLAHLGIWLVLFCLGVIGFWGFGLTYVYTTLGLLVSALSLLVCFVSFQVTLYILALCFRAGTIFSLDQRGLRDHASFAQVGYILLQDLQRIRIQESLIGDFIVIHLAPSSRALSKMAFGQKIMSWWILRLFPDKLIIPMGVIDASRMNLETQFSHFGAILRENKQKLRSREGSDKISADHLNLKGSRFEGLGQDAAPPLSRAIEPDEDRSVYREPFVDPPEMESVEVSGVNEVNQVPPEGEDVFFDDKTPVSEMTLITDKSGDDDETHELGTFVPPPTKPDMSEKSQVLNQVLALKKYVVAQQIDVKLCDAFTEYVCNFPKWQINQDPRIPSSVSEVRKDGFSEDYEEISFRYREQRFAFSLRRDIGPSDLALLSLSYKDRVRVSLRVSVEIGALDPERIEVYHRGKWEKLFLALYAELTGDDGFLREETAELTATTLDLEILKQNFGIKREGDDD